jgi:prepilin-type N-terminal cleavage/methylation domain-containing protein
MSIYDRALNRPDITRNRDGFTLVELLIVMIIAGILLSYAVPSFMRMTASQNAQNARDRMAWMANRARSIALTRGQVQLFEIDPARNAAWIVRRNPTTPADTTEIVFFGTEYSSTLTTSTGTTITLCFSARGYAFSCSGNSPAINVEASLTHIEKVARARIKPLGQIERI